MSVLEFKAEELPSRGTTYPEGTIFLVNKFSYGEVQDLNAGLSVETKIDKFCKAVQVNTDLKTENITYLDYIYMHLGRTASVHGNDTLQFPIVCPYCENEVTHKVNFSELDSNDISEYADIMPLTYPINGQEFSFNFLTLEKTVKWFRLVNNIQQYDLFIELQKQHEAMAKEIEKITPENPNQVLQAKWEVLHKRFIEMNGRMTAKNKARAVKYKDYGLNALLLAFMCTEFGTEQFDQFLSTVGNATDEAITFLQFVEDTLGHGIKPIKITCPHCSKIFVASLEDNINDVYPFRPTSADIANKLRAMQKAKGTSESVEE